MAKAEKPRTGTGIARLVVDRGFRYEVDLHLPMVLAHQCDVPSFVVSC